MPTQMLQATQRTTVNVRISAQLQISTPIQISAPPVKLKICNMRPPLNKHPPSPRVRKK